MASSGTGGSLIESRGVDHPVVETAGGAPEPTHCELPL